ncbi:MULTISPECIES: carbohydrate ABC transporter permease [Paenibacillus]|uniref:carbohydrate ABC transporter permease n=1 Tax=Paenibacillus TaxID=44249 RepID=UPI00203B5233|nr:sugar ABC transporter permease [Paenibacillus camelliae]MCM3634771.1 sugar ABC transporter permease [Paenibacillus camelliae]
MLTNQTITRRKNNRSFSKIWKEHGAKYLLIMPFAILFIVFTVIPVMASMVISFTSFNMLEAPSFVGFRNYINLIVNDDIFLIAVKNTLFFALITGPISYLMCFVFSWLINELTPKVRAIMTLVFYAPSISGNAYLIWKLIFSSDMYGYANSWLLRLGFITEPILFFDNKDYVFPILILVQLWLSLGVSFLAFIAGLQNVDKTLYEAGSIDGIKNRWQELWYITLPSMRPQLLFGAVMQITASFSVSQLSIELAGFPSVEYSGHTILTHLHDYGFIRYEMGYASAIATILFFTMLFTNIIVQKALRRVGA